MADCLFCRISRGEIPSSFLYEDDMVIAFRDIHPRARVHILVVPREHIVSLAEFTPGRVRLLARLIEIINGLAKQEGIADSGYRVVTNIGPDSGQEVPHLHFHLLGGEKLGGLGRA